MKLPSITFRTQRCALLLAIPLLNLLAIGGAQGEIEPAAQALVESVSTKLKTAQTVHLTAKHKVDPSLAVGGKLGTAPLDITLKRPNQFYILQAAENETRELSYDGATLCLLQPGLKIHALEPLKAADISQVTDAMEERFGFRPPIADFLGTDLAQRLLSKASSATITGTEQVGWTRCSHLQVVQGDLTIELWVGVKDQLPRKLRFSSTGRPSDPQWEIRLSKWKLDQPVDESLFTKKPAEDSVKVQMIKRR